MQFAVMATVGVLFNAMNVMAYRRSDLYLSATLLYGGVLMGVQHDMGPRDLPLLVHGALQRSRVWCWHRVLNIDVSNPAPRAAFFVTDNQWLRRMISHHQARK